MVDVTKPIYGDVWANTGEKLAPDSAKIATGWIQEMMPYQYENFLQNRADTAITYLLQKGVAEWSSDQEYIANKSVVTYGGQLYMATATTTNVLPTVTASWKKLSVSFGANGAIPVSFGGTGATTAVDARTNLGIGSAATANLPTGNGMLVKLTDNTLVARSVAGTAGYITVTNGDGVDGNLTINIGANVAKTDSDAAWTTTSSIRIPSGSTAQRGTGAPGRIRFNLETGIYEGYDNVGWNPIGGVGTLDVQNFQGDGVRTTFTLSSTPRAENNTQVYFNGVYQQKNTYNLVGNDLVFDEAPTSDISIEVVNVSSVPIGTTTAAQTSIVDSGNYYNSSNVEGALQQAGGTLSKTILSFPTFPEAQAAAATLPDGQDVEAPDAQGKLSRYRVQSGALVFQRLSEDAARANYMPSGVGAVARTVQEKLREVVSVKDFGAVGDGVTNDTAAINAALSAIYSTKKALFFPAGIYMYDGGGSLGSGNVLYGEGRNATTIKSRLSSPTSGYLIRALGYGSGIRGLRFESAVTQTAGSYVWLSGPETFIEDFHMTGDFNGVWMTGNVSRIRHGRFQDGAPQAIRIKAEGGDNSQMIDDVLMGAQSPQVSSAGIRVRNSSALIISNTSVIQQGYGLLIDPYSNTTGSNTVDTDSGNVFSLYAHHCFFDNNSEDAVRVAPTGNASVLRIRFDNCWLSSSTKDGVYINNSGTGILQGVHFESCHVGLNGGSGLTTGGTVSDIQVIGGWFCQNLFGMYFGNGVSNITVSGCTIGSGAGLSGNTNNGIVLESASINNIVIANNRMVGNGGAAIIDNSTGAIKIIFNNTGATSVGTSIDISGPAGGQIKFPTTQNPSSDANTLDDYKEGTWTPTLTFATPGDLSVSYVSNTGQYTKIGRMVVLSFQIVTSSFTWTTASGNAVINGVPFAIPSGFATPGTAWFQGITKAGYTQFAPTANPGTSTLLVRASGSGQASGTVRAADMPSGGVVEIRGTAIYFV